MKIYMSYAEKDAGLAREVAASLRREGLGTAGIIADLFPGDNWGSILGHDLESADWCVFLFTPGSRDVSDRIRADFTYVVSDLRYKDRVAAILIADPDCKPEEVHWALRNLPTFRHIQASDADCVAEEIVAIVHGSPVHA